MYISLKPFPVVFIAFNIYCGKTPSRGSVQPVKCVQQFSPRHAALPHPVPLRLGPSVSRDHGIHGHTAFHMQEPRGAEPLYKLRRGSPTPSLTLTPTQRWPPRWVLADAAPCRCFLAAVYHCTSVGCCSALPSVPRLMIVFCLSNHSRHSPASLQPLSWWMCLFCFLLFLYWCDQLF